MNIVLIEGDSVKVNLDHTLVLLCQIKYILEFEKTTRILGSLQISCLDSDI